MLCILNFVTGSITDFEFSPFDDDLLASGAEDGIVKLWKMTDHSCVLNFGPFEGSVNEIHFHPQANNVLAFTTENAVRIWDVQHQREKFECCSSEKIQAFCWNGIGSLVATISKTNKEKKVIIHDPRSNCMIGESMCHTHLKDSYVTWLGNGNNFVSAGYNTSRDAEIALWDLCNLSKPITKQSLGNASGLPLMFYDEDTCMLYVCIKGETSINFFELQDKDPYLSIGPNSYRSSTQIKGLCMIPKQAVDVMSCEVARLLILTQNAIVPVGFHVQRKSHSEFHSDLYPDTAASESAMTVDQWLTGGNATRKRVSLDPLQQKQVMQKKTVPQTSEVKDKESSISMSSDDHPDSNVIETSQSSSFPAKKPVKIVRSSKVRYIEGKLLHSSVFIQKLPKLSNSIPGESNGFSANKEIVAVALASAGGLIGIFQLKSAGRVDMRDVPVLENNSGIMDFVFDPFNTKRLAVACDDACITIWDIPDDSSLKGTMKEPSFSLCGHYEKVNILAFHPQASDILASASYDCKICIWNLRSKSMDISLGPLPEQVLAMSWSCDGKMLACLSRDHIIRIYEPRISIEAIKEGIGPSGSRGARLVWLDEKYLLISGFDKGSCRIISLYSSYDLSVCLSVLSFDVTPTILIPHYDPDIRVIYLTGKGDSVILTVEFDPNEDPFLHQTASFSCPTSHQSLVFLPKILCDVKRVEVGYGVRLCASSIEPLVFKIPRVKSEYFQEDLYPETLQWWKSSLTAEEWMNGKDSLQSKISLQPKGMKLLSEAPQTNTATRKFPSYNPQQKTDQEKKEELIGAMITKMSDHQDGKLPQDEMDGVDSDEWDD